MIVSTKTTNTTSSQSGEISSELISLLSSTIEQLILADDFEFISEHQLIKTLQSPPYNLLSSLTLKHSNELFQLHFLIFHSLYCLKTKWLQDGIGELLISPLKIGLANGGNFNKINCNKAINSNCVTKTDKLAEYYLNLDHLTATTTQEIDQLILCFWKEFYQPTAHQDALTLLNLSPPVVYGDIKKQYKRLVSKHHPDKGGSTETIQKINQAMATLSHIYKAK